jgi:hypothetical protein
MSEEIVTPEVTEAATEVVQDQSAPSSDSKQDDAPVESDSPKAETTEKSEVDKLKEAYEKRIARQTAANRELQRRYEGIKAEAEKYASKPQDPAQGRPDQDDFSSIEEYAEALADWKADQKEKAKAAEQGEQKTVEERARELMEHRLFEAEFLKKEQAFREKEPGYDKAAENINIVLDSGIIDKKHPSFQTFVSALMNAPDSPALINYLGNNISEVLGLLSKGPFEVEDKLLTIIDSLNSGAPKTEQKRPDLPEPPSSLKGASSIKTDPMKMDKDDFRNWVKNK